MMGKIHELYAAVERLSKREKMVLCCTVLVVSLTFVDRLLISPVSGKLRSLDKEIEDKETVIRNNFHIVALQDKITTESAKYDAFSKSLQMGEEDVTSLLKEIENMANKSSVYLVDMKSGEFKNTGSSKKYVVTLNGEAQMEQIVEFMHAIESSDKLLTIEKYQISPKSKESSIAKCSMTISKIVTL